MVSEEDARSHVELQHSVRQARGDLSPAQTRPCTPRWERRELMNLYSPAKVRHVPYLMPRGCLEGQAGRLLLPDH